MCKSGRVMGCVKVGVCWGVSEPVCVSLVVYCVALRLCILLW